MTQLAIINGETKTWSDSKGWIKPGYISTPSNPEPIKIMKHITLTDSDTGEVMEADVETVESLRARLAWSKTAGADHYRSFDIWLLERKARTRCNQCGETAPLTTFHREGKYDLELCAECTPAPRCNHCGFELHTSETDKGQVTCCDCRGLEARDRAEAEYWREKCGL